MARSKNREKTTGCPAACLFRDIEKALGEKTKFDDHMTQSKIEILKGIRSLLDEKIEQMNQKDSTKGKKKAI